MRMLSHIGSMLRGSVGGITYTANQFHQIVARTRTAPVDPNTTNQAAIRSALSHASQDWEDLTPAERALWESYARTVVYSGPLGDYSIPGRQIAIGGLSILHYVKTRGLLVPIIVTTPPLVAGRINLLEVAPATFTDAGQTGIAVGFFIPIADLNVVLAERSIGFNPTRLRYKGPFDSFSSQAISQGGPASTLIKWGGLVEGQAYFIRVRAVLEEAPARYSVEYIIRTIAVTNP